MFYRFTTVIVAPDDRENAYAQEILGRLKEVNDRPFEVVESDAPYQAAGELLKKADDPLLAGKQILILESYKGELIKKCPGTDGFLCCNYYTLNIQKGCTIDCYYCILQEYLRNNPVLSINLNLLDLFEKLDRYAEETKGLIRIGTGELTDSLHLERITHSGKMLVEYFAKKKNYLFELKTKSDEVETLLNLDHKEKTLISWSVNPQSIIDCFEPFSASLQERITAMKKVIQAGYKVGFHFDPLVMVDGWEDLYKELIEQLSEIPAESVLWISMGGLRYSPEVREVMFRRDSGIGLLQQPFVLHEDRKYRYHHNERIRLFKTINGLLKKRFPQSDIYLCMENRRTWDEVFGTLPDKKSILWGCNG